jgi:hypothetical protein
MKKGVWPAICTEECGLRLEPHGVQGSHAPNVVHGGLRNVGARGARPCEMMSRIRRGGSETHVWISEKYFGVGVVRPRPELGPKATRPYDCP